MKNQTMKYFKKFPLLQTVDLSLFISLKVLPHVLFEISFPYLQSNSTPKGWTDNQNMAPKHEGNGTGFGSAGPSSNSSNKRVIGTYEVTV